MRKASPRNPNGKRRKVDDGHVVFTRFITTRSGKRIYASQYGLKAFRIRVKKKRGA